jgi:hypothetical protein
MLTLIFAAAAALSTIFTQTQSAFLPLQSVSTQPAPPRFYEIGVAVFDLKIDSDGNVVDDDLLQGQPQFVARSELAFRAWRFMRPPLGDTHVNATFLYKPQLKLPNSRFIFNLPVPELRDSLRSPFPTRIVDPGFPADGVAGGEVVLQVGLDTSGTVVSVNVIQGPPTLKDLAVSAVHEWKFYVPPAADELSRTAVVVIYFEPPVTNVGNVGPVRKVPDEAVFLTGPGTSIPPNTSGALLTDDPQSLIFRYDNGHWTLPYSWITQIRYVSSLPGGDLVTITYSEPDKRPQTLTFQLPRHMALSAASTLSARTDKPVDFATETRESVSLGH